MKINNLEAFKAKVSRGETCLGYVTTSFDDAFAEIAGDSGMDFIWIDGEHSPFNEVDILHQIMATRGTGCAPFVRVPWAVNWLLKPILDMGPAAVIIPMVNDAETARAMVRACRYPWDGGERGVGTRRQTKYGNMDINEFWEISKHEPMIIFQIEHKDAVENLDEILAVPGWDSVCIGPYDLSSSYGKPGQFSDPEIQEALYVICEKTRKAGKMVGGFLAPNFPLKFHVDWRAIGGDFGFMIQGMNAARERALKDDMATASVEK